MKKSIGFWKQRHGRDKGNSERGGRRGGRYGKGPLPYMWRGRGHCEEVRKKKTARNVVQEESRGALAIVDSGEKVVAEKKRGGAKTYGKIKKKGGRYH